MDGARPRRSSATLPMPTPFASSFRACAIWACSAPGRPKRLRTMPALVVKWPSRLVLALMALPQATKETRNGVVLEQLLTFAESVQRRVVLPEMG